jgi:hypothetical protein
MRTRRNGDVLSSHLRAPAAMVALMILVAAALAWLGAGCSSTATPAPDAATDSSAHQIDTAADTTAPADGPVICSLDATYTYDLTGGLGVVNVQTTLAPPASYRHTKTFVNIADPPPPLSCTPAIPTCGDPARIDVSDITRDLGDPDVVHAMAAITPPLYGLDSRPTDGVMFRVLRDDGHGFLSGPPCDTGEFCHGPVPTGISRLVGDLQALDQQQLADPGCVALTPPHP